jgi:hypothetical protein
MDKRRRFRRSRSLEERLTKKIERLREMAELLAARDEALRQARRAELGSQVSEWLRFVQPPKSQALSDPHGNERTGGAD